MLKSAPNFICLIKCAGLNTSTCQYPVIVIAPPAGSRKFGTYKWFWIFLLFFLLMHIAHRSLSFLKPPLAVSPGARSLSSLLAALILLLLFSKLNRNFEGLNMLEKTWNFAHASELAKIYIWYMFQKWVWAKWLDSATYTLSTECASSCVSRTSIKVGTLM